jgi:hypothetical protein
MIVNGETFDLSTMDEGDTLPREAIQGTWLRSPNITRTNGALVMTIVLPYGANAPKETRYAEMLIVSEDGPVTFPAYDIIPAAEEEEEIPSE